MVDVAVLIVIFVFAWSILVLATSGLITVLEHLYCTCKPTYNFTSYVPTNAITVALWPLILPLLLLEVVYIAVYCITSKLRN